MPSEIPDGWTREPLKHLGVFHKSRGASKADAQDDGVPVIRYGELYTRHDDVIRGFHSYVSEVRASEYTKLHIGDVLFAGSGETLAEIGKSAVFLGPDPAHGSGDIIILRPDSKVDPLFLGYATNGPEAVEQKSQMGQGSSVMHIYSRNLENLVLNVPPLAEQKKIAAILASVDDAIEATEAIIEQTRRVKDGLLQNLLTRGIGHTQFKQTDIGEIPESWKVKRLEEVLPKSAIQNGLYRPSSDYGEQGIPIIRIDSFQHAGVVDLSNLRRLTIPDEDAQGYLVQNDDIVLNRVNSLSHLAKSSIIRGLQEPSIFESNMMRLRLPDDCGVRPGFLIAVLALPYAWEHFQLRAKKAVAQASVNQGDVMAMTLAVPPIEEQARIEAILTATDSRIELERRSLRQQRHVKIGLLQDLLTGAVRVSA